LVTSSPLRLTNGFTLLESLTVISIIVLLAALLFPAFTEAKRAALRTPCESNLRQIGIALGEYGTDWDDRYPWAVDKYIRSNRESHQDYPQPFEEIPDLLVVMGPYIPQSSGVWICPADKETYLVSWMGPPTIYESAAAFAGTSYGFDTLTYFGKTHSSVDAPMLRVAQDAGSWHSDFVRPSIYTKATNTLFGDGHVRFVSMMDRL
jgi:prepilin-type N-terminal cleavage/methylation domain-containing protein/prepilin-type processing-associated H-X9-DG protein